MTPAPSTVSRHLDATRDLGVVRDRIEDGFARRGRPSGDPVVFGKVTFEVRLEMFCDGTRAERRLIWTARLNRAHGPDRPVVREQRRGSDRQRETLPKG